MSTYRVVTVHKTVFVHNVIQAGLDEDPTGKLPPTKLKFLLVDYRAVEFPLQNVVSWERTQ